MFNKNILLTSLCTIALCASFQAQAGYQHSVTPPSASSSQIIKIATNSIEAPALKFVQKMANDGIGFLENSELNAKAREAEFRKLLKGNFDMKTIGKFALGSYWKTSSKAQQKEYLKLFENMIITVYSKRFGDYKGQKLNVLKAQPKGKRDVIVSSMIVPKSGPQIDVNWRVRKQKNGQFKVIDIMVEGVSMTVTQRADFKSVIQRGGGDVEVLLAKLRP